MSAMEKGVMTGVIIGLLIVGISLIKKRRAGAAGEYDERQLAIRGKGYGLGFGTLVAELFIYGFVITEDTVSARIDPAVVILGMIYLAGLVMVAYNVMHDAYFGIKNKENQLIVYWLVIGISQMTIAMVSVSDGSYLENGRIGLKAGISGVTGGFFFLFLIILLVKKLADRREDAE